MSRRALAVLAFVVASSSLTACADSLTAPRQQPTLAPSAPRQNTIAASACGGGYVLSEGRCG